MLNNCLFREKKAESLKGLSLSSFLTHASTYPVFPIGLYLTRKKTYDSVNRGIELNEVIEHHMILLKIPLSC